MFNTTLVTAKLRTTVGWEDFWNLATIPALGATLNTSSTGQYYQNFHEAVRLDYISTLISETDTLVDYLDRVVTKAIPTLLNEISTRKQLANVGRDLSSSDIVFSMGNKVTNIVNESRFCGVMFQVRDSVGIAAIVNRIGLFLTAPVTDLEVYLFHSSQEQVISKTLFTTTRNNSFSWIESDIEMFYDNGDVTGGTWYVGYYQDDLVTQTTQAVSYQAMNFVSGPCVGCGQGENNIKYHSIYSHLYMCGFYVPSASLPVSKDELFDVTVAVKTSTNNWGFNFNITVGCDLTQFWIDNRKRLANCLGLQVAISVLKMYKFSDQINQVEEALKIMIIRDLEGTTDTGLEPLHKTLNDSIDALILDNGNINTSCLPCARKPQTRYGAIG